MICRRAVFMAVLKVDFHNEECFDKILQSIRSFPDVEEASIDRFAIRPTMAAMGNIDIDPRKLGNWIEKKTKHKVEVLCSAEEQKAYRQVHAEHHCNGCCQRITITVLKTLGLEQPTIDRQNNRIIWKAVKSTMKTNGFAEPVSKKIRSHMKIMELKTEKRCNGQTTACQVGRGVAAVTIAAIRSACCLRCPPALE